MQQKRVIDFTNLRQLKQGYEEIELSFQDKTKLILYLNLTHDQTIQQKIKRLITDPQELKNGFFGKFQDNQEFINFYYFQNLCKIDQLQTIDLKELSKVKLFFLQVVKNLSFISFNVVLHYNSILIEQQKNIVYTQLYQIFDGFEIDLSKIIYISSDSQDGNIVGYKGEEKNQDQTVEYLQKIKDQIFYAGEIKKVVQSNYLGNKLQFDLKIEKLFSCNEFNNQLIKRLNQQNYQYLEFNEQLSIGVDCNLYISKEMQVYYDQIINNILRFQIKIQELLELPLYQNFEGQQSNHAKEFSKNLFSMLNKIDDIIHSLNKQTLDSTNKKIFQIIDKFESPLLESLRCLAQQHSKFKKYMNVQKIFDIQFYLGDEDDQQLINFFQNYKDDMICQDIRIIQQQNCLRSKFQKQHLPQYLQYFQFLESSVDMVINQDKLIVVTLGLTKAGKSTLLNNVINPKNMKIISNEQRKSFDVIDNNLEIQISQTCNSETQKIVMKEIDEIQFIDTPGFQDTTAEKRLLNQLMIIKQLQDSKQVILLIVIDGNQWNSIKSNLIETLQQINSFFGDKLNQDVLSKCVLPVFNKLHCGTMNQIIDKWYDEIIKDQEDQNIKAILDIIKHKIDKGFYVEILDADQYQETDEIINLKKQILEMQKKVKTLRGQKEYNKKEFYELLIHKEDLEEELEDKNGKSIDFNKLQKIKDTLITKCKTLQQEQEESQIQFEFSLKLNPEMQVMYNKIVESQDEICSYFLEMKTNIIIKYLFKDYSQKIDHIINISKEIQTQIDNYKQKEDYNIFQFFDFLSQQFQDIFQAQYLVYEQIKKFRNFDLFSSLIVNGKKINKIEIVYIEKTIIQLLQACTNVQNKNPPILEWIGMQLTIYIKNFFSTQEQVDQIRNDYQLRLEQLKFLNLKIEYKRLNPQIELNL